MNRLIVVASIVLLPAVAAAQQPAAPAPAGLPSQVTFYGSDQAGWSAAYGEVFGTAENPTKPARSSVGVLQLVNPDWLIEIEAFAVFPK